MASIVFALVGILIYSCIWLSSASDLCPDAVTLVNVTSREDCNRKCITYKKNFSEMTFTCSQATISPRVNETEIYLCTLLIQSDWKMWIKNTERPNIDWKPFTHERYMHGFSLPNGDFFGGDLVAGNVGDGMIRSRGSPFSSQDWDSDGNSDLNIARYRGPWWHRYSSQGYTHFLNGEPSSPYGIQWDAWKWGQTVQDLKRAEVHIKCKGAE